ncbi:MAG: VCBS repeat-containing protein [Deltaproteobacteria bacterium]|nr:VCBS repeat-containing protein [Deltaproteobacteria bacterium]
MAQAEVFVRDTTSQLRLDDSDRGNAAWGDLDGDGDLDAYVPGTPPALYQNHCDGHFSRIRAIPGGVLTDVGMPAWLARWIDYDNDGRLDLFVPWAAHYRDAATYGKRFLYRNLGGRFERVTGAGPLVSDTNDNRWQAWADLDHDGYLDALLAATAYTTSDLYFSNGHDATGAVTFRKDVTSPVATDMADSSSATFVDIDNDGDMDLYMTNTWPNWGTQPNRPFLYWNDGTGTFTRDQTSLIVTDPGADHWFGGVFYDHSWADYDNDQDLDLLVGPGAMGRAYLYRNEGDTDGDGIADFSRVDGTPITRHLGQYGLPSIWGDVDNDGDLDVFIGTSDPSYLFWNNGDGTFTEDAAEEFTQPGKTGRSWGSFVDLDHDGDVDLFLPQRGDNVVYTNQGNGNHWVQIDCQGTVTNRMAVGARVYVTAVIGGASTTQMREIHADADTGGVTGGRAHFGLGDASVIDEIRIVWPTSATEQRFRDVPVDQFVRVIEGVSDYAGAATPCKADLPVPASAALTGRVYAEDDAVCSYDPGSDLTMAGVIVQAEPGPYYAITNRAGDYTFDVPAGSYTVEEVVDVGFEPICPGSAPEFVVSVADGMSFVVPDIGNALHNHCDPVDATAALNCGNNAAGLGQLCVIFSVGNGFGALLPINGNPWATVTIDTGPATPVSQTPPNCLTNPLNFGSSPCTVCFTEAFCSPPAPPPQVEISWNGTCGGDPFVRQETAQCPCDPNDKHLLSPPACGADNIPRGEPLTYQIRFQNVGTAPAHEVVLVDALDDDLDLATFSILDTSHTLTAAQIKPDRSLVLRFDDLELPPESWDAAASTGHVIYRVSPVAGLPAGTEITNDAAIYFDYNESVITNRTHHVLRDGLDAAPDMQVRHACGDKNLVYDFAATGDVAPDATYLWNFGPDASPSISTEPNPSGVRFGSAGTHDVTLTVDQYGGCVSTRAVPVEVTSVVDTDNNRVTICHRAGAGEHTITVSPAALNAHLAHGDCVAACAAPGP